MRSGDYATPAHEVSRVAELRRYAGGYDSLQEVFNSATVMCRTLFCAEASMVTFIDSDTQNIKAASGVDLVSTHRSDSFCAHTILSKDVMVVLNAADDARFRHNYYVTNAPYIRFYAGAPLRTAAGFNIGALCIIDPSPRKGFATASRAQLNSLAGVISSRLDQLMAGPGDRTETRHAVNLEGTVSSYGKKPQPVAIHNISTRGAMIHSPDRVLPRGEEVVISIDTLALVGTVMWARDGMNGLSFHRAIDDETLQTIQKKRAKASRGVIGTTVKMKLRGE